MGKQNLFWFTKKKKKKMPVRKGELTVTEENEELKMPEGLGKIYPVLPLRDIVLFPHMVVPLTAY